MKTDRLNAFTDGVVAIIITIMVLELPVPKAAGIGALVPELFVFATYALSFVKVGIYWSNHHHMLQVVRKIDGRVLWANLYLLFWLSLIPFVIRWIGEAGVTRDTVLAFGFVMLMCSVAYALLKRSLIAAEGPDSRVAEATGKDTKGMVSIVAYVAALLVAFMSPLIAILIYLAIAAMWLIPDRRFEALDGSGR
jgi:uncharacterized membrane protein